MSSETSDSTRIPNGLFQPTTPNSEPFWHTTPNERSTVDLITSCVLTLLMCVWTAIHLNIPRYKERKKGSIWPVFWRRVAWMFGGLIWPEVVVCSAWLQFIQARLICVRLNRIEERRAMEEGETSAKENNDEKVNPSTVTRADNASDFDHEHADDIELARRRPTNFSSFNTVLATPNTETGASTTHSPTQPTLLSPFQRIMHEINPGELERGYYGVMGGFEIVIGQEPNGEGDIRRTLTPCGIVLLAQMGFLPPISIEAINDKSKADVLTKGLVCVQGLWMIIQSIERHRESLPLTLLELNTIMHVSCALIMYFLWLKKPLDIGLPTRIDDKHPSKPLGALLSIEKVHKGDEEAEELITSLAEEDTGILKWENGQFKYKASESDKYEEIWATPTSTDTPTATSTAISIATSTATSTATSIAEATPNQSTTEATPNQSTKAIKVRHFWIHSTTRPTPGYCLTFRASSTYLTQLNAQFLVDYSTGTIPIFGKSPSVSLDWEAFTTELAQNGTGRYGCTKRAENLFLDGGIKSVRSDWVGFAAATVFPAIYGSIHLTQWSAHFPTRFERYAWRFSGLYIAVGVPALILLYLLLVMIPDDEVNPLNVPFLAIKYIRKKYKPASERWVVTKAVVYPLLVIIMIPVFVLLTTIATSLFVLAIMYPLTRLYILVEAFASLRSMPEGAFKTVEWTDMWPHF